MSGSDGMSSQEASVAIEKMLKMQEKIKALEKIIEEQRLGAERDTPREGTEGGGRWGGERRSSCEGTSSVDGADTWAGSPIRPCHQTLLYTTLVYPSRDPQSSIT